MAFIGSAAVLVGGRTCNKLTGGTRTDDRWHGVNMLIIDEFSMLLRALFGLVAAQSERRNPPDDAEIVPMGPTHVVCVGDPYQLDAIGGSLMTGMHLYRNRGRSPDAYRAFLLALKDDALRGHFRWVEAFTSAYVLTEQKR